MLQRVQKRESARETSDHVQGNQNLPEMRRENFFGRPGRALCRVCVENDPRVSGEF